MPQTSFPSLTSEPPTSPQAITLRAFRPEDATAFRELNEEWITTNFVLEESDRVMLNDPLGQILAPGGYIFVAAAGEEVIGCCALVPHAPAVFELAKMAVAPRYRGVGIGRKVLAYTIEQARTLDLGKLYLESSSRLANAVHLYESLGFRHLRPEEIGPSPYERANVFMDMEL